MTAPTLAEVRDDLESVLELIDGWRATAWVGNQINPPQCVVSRLPYDPRLTLNSAKAIYHFQVTAYAPFATPVESEKLLDDLADPRSDGSLIATVQNGSNWSVTIDYAQVVNVGQVSAVQFGNDAADYLACPFEIEVVW